MAMIGQFWKELRGTILRIVKHPYFGFILLGVALLLIRRFAESGTISPSLYKSISSMMIYSIIALGFSLLLGYAGLASLGTAGYVGLGT